MKAWLLRLWNGEVPLWRAFWLYMIVGLFFAGPLALMLVYIPFFLVFDSLPPLMGLLALVFIAYSFVALVGTWRSANRYEFSKAWPFLAKAVILLIVAGLLISAPRRFEMLMNMLVA